MGVECNYYHSLDVVNITYGIVFKSVSNENDQFTSIKLRSNIKL